MKKIYQMIILMIKIFTNTQKILYIHRLKNLQKKIELKHIFNKLKINQNLMVIIIRKCFSICLKKIHNNDINCYE